MGSLDFEKTSSESIQASAAGYSGLPGGLSIVAIVTVESQPGVSAVNSIYSFDSATATSDLLFGLDGNNSNWLSLLYSSTIINAGFGLSTLSNWYLVSVTKIGGGGASRFEVYNYTTGTWSSAAGGAAGARTTGTGTVGIGCGVGSVDFWDGRIAALGVWKRALISGEVRQLIYRKQWLNSLRRFDLDGGKQYFDLSRRTSPNRYGLDFFQTTTNYSVGTQPAVGLLVNDSVLHHPPGW